MSFTVARNFARSGVSDFGKNLNTTSLFQEPLVALGPVEHLEISDEIKKSLESPFGSRRTETRMLHNYLPLPTQMYTANVQAISLEQFAQEFFKVQVKDLNCQT